MMLSSRRGFTLVELSIVLVILGLLVGGVLAGQSLIRAAELRAVVSEKTKYITAVNAFRDKYFALPGDITNATSFWTSGTANGNGDGSLDRAASGGTTGEIFQFWNMLSLAGLVEGSYSGLAGAASNNDSIPGTNTPKSKLNGAGWSVLNFSNYAGDTSAYAFDYGNFLMFGARTSGSITGSSIIKPEEAWNLDMKIDDGRPATGKVVARENGTWTGATATKCTTSSSNTDYTGTYNLSTIGVNCALYFPKPF